jgi:hypothetical protein
MHYIEVLEQCLGRQAEKNLLPLQPGDVPDTYADVADLVEQFDYKPDTSVETGVPASWTGIRRGSARRCPCPPGRAARTDPPASSPAGGRRTAPSA